MSYRVKDTILLYGTNTAIRSPMETPRRVTVEVPENLLRKAQRSTGKGITATIRQGLELLAAAQSFDEVRRMRGKVRFSIDLDEMREDRP